MKRRSLTPKQRHDMWSDQRGRCKWCDDPITLQHCIGEHIHPVVLGNDQKPDCLLCIPCADRKTNGTKATTCGSDKQEIAKADRLEGDRLVREGADPRYLTEREQKVFHRALRRSVKKIDTGARMASRPFQKPPEGHSWNWPNRKAGQ